MDENYVKARVILTDGRKNLIEIEVKDYAIIQGHRGVPEIRKYTGDSKVYDGGAFLLEARLFEKDKERGVFRLKDIIPLYGFYTTRSDYCIEVKVDKNMVETRISSSPGFAPLKSKGGELLEEAWSISRDDVKVAKEILGEGECVEFLLPEGIYVETGKIGQIPIVREGVKIVIMAEPTKAREFRRELTKELWEQ